MKNLLTLLLTLVISSQTFGQVQTPKWDVILPSKVKWIQVNDWGIVIAACENGLYGIDPRDGNKIWENTTLTNIKEDFYNTIENTPLILIADKGADAKTVVINGMTGEVIFDSSVEGFEKIVSRKVLPEIEGLLVAFKDANGDGIALYNYVNGSQVWISTSEKTKSKAVQPEPFMDHENNVIFANGSFLYRIDVSNGEILWTYETKKSLIDLFTNPDGSEVYAVSGAPSDRFRNTNTESSVTVSGGTGKFMIDCVELASGNSKWKKPIEYSKAKYSGVALGENDYFLLHTLGANQYPYSSTDGLWKKEKLGTGGDAIGAIFESEDGMIYFSPDGAGRTYGYFVDKEGKQLWKKRSLINGEIMLLEDLGDAFFYISTGEVNVISKSDGKQLWERDKYLSSNYPLDFFQESENEYIVYVGGKLISVDLANKDWKSIAEDFGFRGEVPSGLQNADKAYILTGNQNVMMIDTQGNEIYHTFYPEPEQSFGTKLAMGTLGMASAVGSMAYGMSSVAYGMSGALQDNEAYTKKSQQQAAISSFTADLTGGFDALATLRFGQDVGTRDYKLILTQKEKSIGFVKVGLDDGKEEGLIVTSDRTPTYVIDLVDDKFYLKSGDTRIASYQL